MKISSAQIVCVGTELLLGDIVNTNEAYIAARLRELGVPLYRSTSVGDNPERLKAVLGEAIASFDLVITTGGLGPTNDDLTKETVAELFGLPLVHDAAAEEGSASAGVVHAVQLMRHRARRDNREGLVRGRDAARCAPRNARNVFAQRDPVYKGAVGCDHTQPKSLRLRNGREPRGRGARRSDVGRKSDARAVLQERRNKTEDQRKSAERSGGGGNDRVA